MTHISDQITAASARYTQSERKVADYCLQNLPRVAFQTVAAIAEATATSPPTVMRFATKAGFTGFSELQRFVQESLDDDLGTALGRLQTTSRPRRSDWLGRGLDADLVNLQRTYQQLSEKEASDIADLLADETRSVYLAGGEITHGTCVSFAALLRWLRDDVHVLTGEEIRLATELAHASSRSVFFCFHLRRLTRLIDTIVSHALHTGSPVILVTNSPTLELATKVDYSIVLHVRGAGDVLDSYTAAASLINTFAAAVAARRRSELITRFGRLEHTWNELGTYVE